MIARSAFVSLGLLGLFASPVSAQAPPRAAGNGPRLAEVRRLIEAGVRVYGPPAALEPAVVAWLGPGGLTTLAGAGAVLSDDRLYLASEALDSPHRDTLVAAAMAYQLVERPSRATTLAAYEQELRERARQGNTKTVEVLQRTTGLAVDAAVSAVGAWLLAQHAAASDRHTATMLCEELRDLAAGFPRQAAALPPARCPEAGGAGDRSGRPAPGVVPALLVLIAPAPTARPAAEPPAAAAAPPGGSGSEVPAAYCARPGTGGRAAPARRPAWRLS